MPKRQRNGGKIACERKPKVQKGAGRRNIPNPTADDNGAKDSYGKSNQIRWLGAGWGYLHWRNLRINLVSISCVDGMGGLS